MTFQCDTCKRSFNTKGNLSSHIKSAKYCIKMRNSTAKTLFECNICQKKFTSKQNLQQHFVLCSSHPGYVSMKQIYSEIQERCLFLEFQLKEKSIQMEEQVKAKQEIIDKLIIDKDQMIDKLRSDLSKISIEAINRPSTINNTNNNSHTTNINNLAVFCQDKLSDVVDKNPLPKNSMNDGIPGVARHVGELLKTKFDKPLYVTCNEAKQKFNYKNEEGVINKDYKSKLIIESVGSKLTDQATEHFNITRSNYELRLKINDIERKQIPFLKKIIQQYDQQIMDVPSRKTDHPEKLRLNDKIEKTNEELCQMIDHLNQLKEAAESIGIKLDYPLEFYEDDLGKTTENLDKIRNLKDHSGQFSKTLIETIS